MEVVYVLCIIQRNIKFGHAYTLVSKKNIMENPRRGYANGVLNTLNTIIYYILG